MSRAQLPTLLTASWVVPVVSPPIPRGWVAVRDGRILGVGIRDDAPSRLLRDLGSGVLLPGLVNAHCHLELSHLAGRVVAGSGFVPWVRQLVAARAEAEAAQVARHAAQAIRDLEASGTVAVGDVSNSLDHLGLLAQSGLDAVVFYELLAWDPERAAAVLEGARERLAGLRPRLRPGLAVRLAAHAPHSVSRELLAGLVAGGGPAALHLAESREEARFLRSGNGEWAGFLAERGLGHVRFRAPGQSPVAYVDGLGGLQPGLVAAHCVQVDAADRKTLARRGVHVAVCPRSNRALGVGMPPVPDLLADGVRLCLGTDSLASAPDLDLLEDAAALHREYPDLEASLIVRMATAGGASALGIPDLGSLTPGFRAALAFVPSPRPLLEPLAFLVSGEAHAQRVAS